MVMADNHEDNDGSPESEFLSGSVGFTNSKPSSGPDTVKEEKFPCSSSSHLKSRFVGMGFSSVLVDKVIKENGDSDENLLLEALISSNGEQERFIVSKGTGYCRYELTGPSVSASNKKSYLSAMDFSEEEIDLAVNSLGESASLPELVDFIITTQTVGSSGGSVDRGKGNNKDLQDAAWDNSTTTTWQKAESKLPHHANEEFLKGSRQTNAWWTKASTCNGAWIRKESNPNLNDAWRSNTSRSTAPVYGHHEDKNLRKKAKHVDVEDNTKTRQVVQNITPDLMMHRFHLNTCRLSKPPCVFYGNVVDVSQGTWRTLSQFLYEVQPEFVNTQFFSAVIRKEGYIHNLPTEGRFHISPKPPMTIESALPHTKQWWPAWDTRKQLSFINSETTGVLQICDRLGKMMIESRGIVSTEQLTEIIHHCKRLNLVWVSQYKLRPIEPEQIESFLGYPMHHTETGGLGIKDRLSSLKFCFQTDTIGYYLSVLKSMYPDGLKVLSIFTGIGGAEIALHRLGIRLKCVVSVEPSEIKREILKRWWNSSGQSGELRQVGEIEKMTIQTLQSLVNQFGGFDIIIGSNPADSMLGTIRDASDDMDLSSYFEFVRIVQQLRSMM